MDAIKKNPAPYYVSSRCYLNTVFLYITHEDYPGNAHGFEGTEDAAQREADRLNAKVAARLAQEGQS